MARSFNRLRGSLPLLAAAAAALLLLSCAPRADAAEVPAPSLSAVCDSASFYSVTGHVSSRTGGFYSLSLVCSPLPPPPLPPPAPAVDSPPPPTAEESTATPPPPPPASESSTPPPPASLRRLAAASSPTTIALLAAPSPLPADAVAFASTPDCTFSGIVAGSSAKGFVTKLTLMGLSSPSCGYELGSDIDSPYRDAYTCSGAALTGLRAEVLSGVAGAAAPYLSALSAACPTGYPLIYSNGTSSEWKPALLPPPPPPSAAGKQPPSAAPSPPTPTSGSPSADDLAPPTTAGPVAVVAKTKGVSAGAAAGIAVGACGGVALAAGAAIYFMRRRSTAPQRPDDSYEP